MYIYIYMYMCIYICIDIYKAAIRMYKAAPATSRVASRQPIAPTTPSGTV